MQVEVINWTSAIVLWIFHVLGNAQPQYNW